MADESRNERLRNISVEQINDTYRRGYIVAGSRNQILRDKAHAELEGLVGDKGYARSILEETVKEVQKGWDNLKEATLRVPDNTKPGAELYYLGLAVWGQIQMLSSVFTA